MGQQQLLLLVLATVIVGIATVVGIQAFSQNNAKSNADAMLNDAVRIASDVQAWSQKAKPFGGPVTFGDYGSATFPLISYEATGTPATYSTLNGDFTLASGVITGTKDSDNDGTADQQVQVRVCGLSDDDVKGAVITVGGVGTGTTAAPGC
jgi:hypothetical protein